MKTISQRFHNHRTTRHPGYLKTQQLLSASYWWPGLAQFVWQYTGGCTICQSNKTITHPTTLLLNPIISWETLPFKQISYDLITDPPVSQGFDSIPVVVDHGLSKGVFLCPTQKIITTEGVATIIFQKLYTWFGLFNKIISDWGPQFAENSLYQLNPLSSWKIHSIFHASLLTLYKKTHIHGLNYPAPPPDLIRNNEECEIEQILKHQGRYKDWQYLIWWKGYSAEEDLQTNEIELGNALELLEAYKNRANLHWRQPLPPHIKPIPSTACLPINTPTLITPTQPLAPPTPFPHQHQNTLSTTHQHRYLLNHHPSPHKTNWGPETFCSWCPWTLCLTFPPCLPLQDCPLTLTRRSKPPPLHGTPPLLDYPHH